MPKLFIKLRKWFYLPWKWKAAREFKAMMISYPPKIQIVEMREALLSQVTKAQRNRDIQEENKIKGKLELIEWIINYGSPKK